MLDFRLGRWQDVLPDVGEVDALIVDPPYSARTHAKQRHGRHHNGNNLWVTSRGLGYEAWSPAHVAEFVVSWVPRTRGWFVAFTSHDLVPAWEVALAAAERYVFAPLACVQIGMNVRLAGDGPSNWTVWLVVARPAALHRWGTLPGAYVERAEQGPVRATRPCVGAKPLSLMRAIVRDYSRAGDLVCDPCSGGGTTALACHAEGRRFVGAECDPATYAKAKRRIDDALRQQPLPFAPAPAPEQRGLFGKEPVRASARRRVTAGA